MLAQQAAEKAAKALLAARGQEIPRTHSLPKLFELLEECVDVPTLMSATAAAGEAFEDRYPDGQPEFGGGRACYGKPESKRAIADSRRVLSWAEELQHEEDNETEEP